MSSSLSYDRTAILLTSVNAQVFGSVATLTGSLTIIALSGWVDLSINWSRKVGIFSGWGDTTFAVVAECNLHFWWAHLAALFQVVLLQVYSICHSVNGSMTCFASSDVSPAFSLSHWANLNSSMPCSSGGHLLGTERCMHPFLLPSFLYSALVRVWNHPGTVNRCQNCCLKMEASSLGKIFFIQM